MSEYIYYFISVGENKVQEWLVRLSLKPQILWKTGKVTFDSWVRSIVLAQSDKSKLESKRVSLWSGSISSTATRPAFWPGSAGTHVMPQLHKRFSFPPDKLVTVTYIPSVRQIHPRPIQNIWNLWKMFSLTLHFSFQVSHLFSKDKPRSCQR